MKRTMAVLTVMCVAACGFMPSGGNYPYDMYDRDIENVIELIKDPNGSSVGVLGVNSEEFPEGMHTLEQVQGNTKSVEITKKVHVAMRGRYYLKIVTTTGEVKNLQIGYFPNMGRMELAVWDSDN